MWASFCLLNLLCGGVLGNGHSYESIGGSESAPPLADDDVNEGCTRQGDDDA